MFEPGSSLVLYEDKSGVGIGWRAVGYFDSGTYTGLVRGWWSFWKWYTKKWGQ